MEDLAKTVTTLTSLIEVNNKRVKVYRKVAEKASKEELKSLFNSCAEQSKSFSGNLATWRAAYGGFGLPEQGNRSIWGEFKSMLTRARNPVHLCEEVEQDTLRAYRTAVANSILPSAAIADVQRQSREVERVLARLQALKKSTSSIQS
jgi:uncharacterized protein (TIGR02284 family)